MYNVPLHSHDISRGHLLDVLCKAEKDERVEDDKLESLLGSHNTVLGRHFDVQHVEYNV